MAGHIVVGYSATKQGQDALAFGARLAAAIDGTLDVAIILPDARSSSVPNAGYDRYLRQQAKQWLADAVATIPPSVAVAAHVRTAESFAEGLIDLADAIRASYIVVGPADGAKRGLHRLGSTASELLHSSDVPVVLVPRGARKTPFDTPIGRLTVAVGNRPGADALVAEAGDLASALRTPVRLLSLLPVDLPATADTAAIRIAGSGEVSEVLAAAQTELPADVEVDVVVAEGESIEAAVASVPWQNGEVLLAGSSRLAQPRRLFLGSTAAKMLHVAPVPVIVVPRTRNQEGGQR